VNLTAHLGLRVEPVGAESGLARGHVAVRPDLCTSGGALRVGVLATLVDTVGGLVTGLAVLPDWVVTADLSVRSWAAVRHAPAGAEARVLRRGRTTAIAEVTITGGAGGGAGASPCAAGVLTSSVLTPDFALPKDMAAGVAPPAPPPPPAGQPPLAEWLGIRVRPDGAEVDVDGPLLNPWGMVHGGVTALLVDHAVEAAVGPAPTGLLLRYLRPARTGPIRATVRVTAPTVAQVVVTDEGAEGREVARAVVELSPGPGPSAVDRWRAPTTRRPPTAPRPATAPPAPPAAPA
jgi:acyl-coenzyme A thioesterase PaaI-like protein